jgi:hypothetical protein
VFVFLMAALLVAAAIHAALVQERTINRIGRIALLYLLVGYCGVPMVVVSAGSLANPEIAHHLAGSSAGGPFVGFTVWALLGMSILSLLALWYRGTFLVGPAVCWAVFFGGATGVHLGEFSARGALTHGGILAIFASHGLVSLLLIAALLSSGLLKQRG